MAIKLPTGLVQPTLTRNLRSFINDQRTISSAPIGCNLRSGNMKSPQSAVVRFIVGMVKGKNAWFDFFWPNALTQQPGPLGGL